MLILSRKADESILLGEDIRIKVISTDKGIVKLGIDAPSHVSILREELKIAVEHANVEAASKKVDDKVMESFFKQFKPKDS
jgi:carbon storage regulator